MNYKLIKSSDDDIEKLIDYKKKTIFEYAKDLPINEINKINNYVKNNVPKLLNNYFNIVVDDKVVGCLLLTDRDDGVLLDEIYLEEEYRNKGIGTDIIKNVINNNDIIFLWVYKENLKAVSLYKKLGFVVLDETESRYYMKYSKGRS
ncbi:MAG: GNAT family N-acetyltransferase [Bacilli bacterium]|nr:GNAT family N-acetyltransferase [Bacilli bacterium]